jgi:excisionase family DNA binding protein
VCKKAIAVARHRSSARQIQKFDFERMKITLSLPPFVVVNPAKFQVSGPQNGSSSAIGWLTAVEAADYLKVKARSLLRWVREGKIKGYALCDAKRRVWRFRREDLDAALLSHPVLLSETPTVLSTERRIA